MEDIQFEVLLTYLATGALGSLVASGVFLAFLRAIQPRITICPLIARSEFRESGRGSHSIKVINRSWFQLIDVDARLDLVCRHASPPKGEPLLTVTNIPLVTPHLFNLAPLRPRWLDSEAKYAARFAVRGNLEGHLPEEEASGEPKDFLLFRIAATHSLSGFRRVVDQTFMLGAIQAGAFHFGQSCKVGR